ncbi:ectonucleoside triphosphate diphosphohydrolase 4 isoform X2 [Callorhinchus milii]|uniref:ectonucleoside triphosphate diphosphohydrolase 4 isoform X2 n=1 Tax=Callorhinchus milii TaxID=7868 RepID=UPI0004575F40|nr:ectonucleoside triphosphate diphosphohydrolase 4 isoform X2 [Callorhinchus milii]|eukprot:gi/632980881/ref/XP_007907283.1/ PREDICTED: ectonucleoside triphosphate diphosphohydrolase 7 isoform X2 [Callorhinchus milii]
MARFCLFPASWHFSVSPVNSSARQRAGLTAAVLALCLLLTFVFTRFYHWRPLPVNKGLERYLARMEDMEATDTENPDLNYGVIVDCGSSGSRVFVYFWPRHNGKPHDLLDIKQMKDSNRKPVVKKIKPGISTLAFSPEKASDYLRPLLSFAASYVPTPKHKETPLYILCTAGMRLLPDSQQQAILRNLYTDVPLEFDFLFSDSHAEVISGKQEGVYAWIGINFVLGRFDHIEDEDALMAVTVSSNPKQEPVVRKQTVGILDMGGASVQIAYEVTAPVTFTSQEQEEAAKNVLAEFNLGCDSQHTQHVYLVYVATFLGFGGNYARQHYEDLIFNQTISTNRLTGKRTGLSAEAPIPDPCLSIESVDTIEKEGRLMHLRGTGEFDVCRALVRPFLNKGNETGGEALNGMYLSPVDFQRSEFYGFSEFYYCTEDVLRMGGQYHSTRYLRAAKDYCATKWTTLKERFELGLFSSHADLHRLKYQCFKSAWMHQVLHGGFNFPANYSNLRTAQLVYDKEVQWTLGAILYKTRFLPLRDLRQENLKPNHSSLLRFSFVNNHYLLFACFFVVLLSIILYILRLRRIHRRAQQELLWVERGEASSGET